MRLHYGCIYVHICIFISINAYLFLQREGTLTTENWATIQDKGKNRNCPSSQYRYLFSLYLNVYVYFFLLKTTKYCYTLYLLIRFVQPKTISKTLCICQDCHRGPITDPWLSQTWLLHCLRTQVAHIFCPKRLKQCPGSWGLGVSGNTGTHPSPFSQQRAWLSCDSLKQALRGLLRGKPSSPGAGHWFPSSGPTSWAKQNSAFANNRFFLLTTYIGQWQFSAETNHFHKCFQGVLWNTRSEEY